MRACIKCNQEKLLDEFVKDSSKVSGFKNTCKICDNLRKKKFALDNPELHKERSKQSYHRNKEKHVLKKKQYYEENREYFHLTTKEWKQNNLEKVKQYKRNYYERNLEKVRARTRHWRIDNYDYYIEDGRKRYHMNKEELKKYYSDYKRKNADKVTAWNANRRAQKLQATPKWLTEEQKQQIFDIYSERKRLTLETKIEHHVDHIIPLKGKNVSGLHVPWNMQILTESENCKKHNKF